MAAVDPYAQVGYLDFIKIAEKENDEFMEFPKESDETVLLSTIQAQFPSAIGLKYKASSGAWRAIRAVDNVLEAPKGGWGGVVYCLTVTESSNKRKSTSSDNGTRESKVANINFLLQDMAVMGLPFKTTNEEMKEYFESKFGELVYCEVKFDRDSGRSRGFGFIRFKEELAAKEALSVEHYLEGRKIEVRQKKDKPMKLFVGRLPSGSTQEQLQNHFGQFGELKDVYIPTPFRNFAFITYASTEDGRNVLRETHVLDGAHLNVMERNQNNSTPNGDQRNSTNQSSSSFSRKQSGGSQNVSSTQPKANMDADLKNMLFKFLSSQ